MGAAVAGLHSWQGLTLLVMMAGLVLITANRRALVGRLALPFGLTALPLAYFSALAYRYDAWHIVSEQNRGGSLSIKALVVVLGPFVLLAALGVRGSIHSTGDRLLVLWLCGAVASISSTPSGIPTQ